MGDDGSGERTPPPPEDTAVGWGGSGTRVRDEPHDRAQREHAPCKPQRGDHRGCNRRRGRVTTGATQQAPPPQAEGQVPRPVPAPCLRRACAIGRTARTPPPPGPLLLYPPTKRARTARRQRGDMGGGRGQKKKQTTKDTNTPEQGQTAGADGTWREPGGTARGAGQGDTPGDESKEAGTNTATYGGEPGRQEPAKDAGEVPDLWGLGGPPVSVSAPSERKQ